MLRATVAGGEVVDVGAIVSVDDAQARYLLVAGRAEHVDLAAVVVTQPEVLREKAIRQAPAQRDIGPALTEQVIDQAQPAQPAKSAKSAKRRR